MDRRKRVGRQIRWQKPAAIASYPDRSSKQGVGCSCAQSDDDPWCHTGNLCLEPGQAGLDLDRTRFAVDASRSARYPLEVLDNIGNVSPRPVDPGFLEATVQQFSSGTDKGMSSEVFGIARLLTDQHDGGPLGTLAEHRLRGVPVERAGGASGRGLLQGGNCRFAGDQVAGTPDPGQFGFGLHTGVNADPAMLHPVDPM